jgi:hypothetical protein
MNNAFVAEQAKAVIARDDVKTAAEPTAKARAIYRAVLSRDPTSAETEAVTEFVAGTTAKPGKGQLDPWEMAAQVLLLSNEFAFVD